MLVIAALAVAAPLASAVGAVPAAGPADGTSAGTDADAGATDGVALQQDDDDEPTDLREIEFGETRTGEIDENDPEDDDFRGYHEPVTFEGEEGQAVTITMFGGAGDEPHYYGPHHEEEGDPADPYLILLGPDDEVIARNDDAEHGLDSRIQGVVLPEDGEYTIIATSFDAEDTFEYRLSLEQEQEGGADLRNIEVNSTAQGELDKTDPQSQQYRGYYEPVNFTGTAGQSVTIDMGSRPGDTYLMLLGPDGRRIAENDDSGSLNSSVETTLPSDGEYTIIATSFQELDTFEYTLSVQSGGVGSPDLRSIQIGQNATSELDEDDPSARFLRGYYEPVTFEGTAGGTVTIDMSSARGDTYLMLYSPSGDRVAEDDDGGMGLNSQIRSHQLEESGEYTIVATSFSEEDTFSYELSVTSAGEPAQQDLRNISYGETASGRIDEEDPRNEVYRGWHEPVTFDGQEGDEVVIDMQSGDDTYLILLGPEGTVVTSDDDGGEGLNSRIETTLPSDGEYTIIATSFSDHDTFPYTLSLERVGSGDSGTASGSSGGGSGASGSERDDGERTRTPTPVEG